MKKLRLKRIPLSLKRYYGNLANKSFLHRQQFPRNEQGETLCNVYTFSSANPDLLSFDAPFTGNIKLIAKSPATTGIHPDILAGLQGTFIPDEWTQYEADVTAIDYIVGATFNGVVGRFALDNVWYEINMGKTDVILSKAFIKTIAFGDSFTDNGDSPRLPDGAYSYGSRGWWGWANNLAGGYYNMLDAAGISGNQTIDLLNRMDDVLLSGADVVSILIGTNDLNAGRTPEQTRDSMIDIVDQIIANGQYVLINRVTHRELADGLNSAIDTLNSYYDDIAIARDNCGICGDYTEFNSFVDSGNELVVTTDGLHPNSYGAYLLGKVTAKAMDKLFPSSEPALTNEAPNPEFLGNSGLVLSGATGEAPNDWRIYFADPSNGGTTPTSEVGGLIVDGGVRSFKVTTGNAGSALFRSGNWPVNANGLYMFDIVFSCDSTSDFTVIKFRLATQSALAGDVSFQFNIPSGDIKLGKVRFRTPAIDVKDSTYVNMFVDGNVPDGSWTIERPNLINIAGL